VRLRTVVVIWVATTAAAVAADGNTEEEEAADDCGDRPSVVRLAHRPCSNWVLISAFIVFFLVGVLFSLTHADRQKFPRKKIT
jgi:hypothetical protein